MHRQISIIIYLSYLYTNSDSNPVSQDSFLFVCSFSDRERSGSYYSQLVYLLVQHQCTRKVALELLNLFLVTRRIFLFIVSKPIVVVNL